MMTVDNYPSKEEWGGDSPKPKPNGGRSDEQILESARNKRRKADANEKAEIENLVSEPCAKDATIAKLFGIIEKKDAEIATKDAKIDDLREKLVLALQGNVNHLRERAQFADSMALEAAKLKSKATTQANFLKHQAILLESQKVRANVLESQLEVEKKSMEYFLGGS